MISDINNNGDGSIEFDELLEMMAGKMGEKNTREDIEKALKLFNCKVFNCKAHARRMPETRLKVMQAV